jgi:MFS family permease
MHAADSSYRPCNNARWLNSTVFGIGMASLSSDLSHETVTSVLPALLAWMGVAAGALGTIEGVADGLSSAAKLYGGWWTDRLHHRKPLCALGYGAMVTATGLIAAAVTWRLHPLPARRWAVRRGRFRSLINGSSTRSRH